MTENFRPPSKLFLWPERTLYIGYINQSVSLCLPASVLVLSLDNPLTVRTNDSDIIETRSLISKPGQLVSYEAHHTPVVFCMLDALGQDFQSLSNEMNQNKGGLGLDIKHEQLYIDVFKDIYLSSQTPEMIYQRIDKLITSKHQGEYKSDHRIKKVIQLIHDDIESNETLAYYANQIDVSEARLVQLFKDYIGVPLRTYRLWHRLFCAIKDFSKSKNLTECAMAAGFTDTAHFNRTFKKMVGLTPSQILMQSDGLEVYC